MSSSLLTCTFSHISLSPTLFHHPPPGPPSPSGGVLQLHWLQCLHHKWRPAVWLVQCGEHVLQETTVCKQQQFWWSEMGPDNRQVSHSRHFRRRDSLPNRDKNHCESGMTSLCSCETFFHISQHIYIYSTTADEYRSVGYNIYPYMCMAPGVTK